MVGFLILPEALLALVYERGAFTRETTLISAGVLAGFAAGLPAFTLSATLLPAFYAREDMRTPMWGAAANAATNIVVSLILFPIYGPAGIAIATSVAGWVNALFLGYMLWRRKLFRPSSQTLGRVLRIAIATAVTGAFLFWFDLAFGQRMLDGTAVERVVLVAAAIGGSMLLYFSLAIAIGAIDRSYLKALANRLRSRRSGGSRGGPKGGDAA
jgi:putative peptidoglycan lipid II flippase